MIFQLLLNYETPSHQTQANRRDEPFFGFNGRVARKLGKSESLISMVRRGVAASSKVADAIEEEARLMFEEWSRCPAQPKEAHA